MLVKTVGQMIDELCIANNKIWHLIDKIIEVDLDKYNNMETIEEMIASVNDLTKFARIAKDIQVFNKQRVELIRAIDQALGGPDIGGKVYS